MRVTASSGMSIKSQELTTKSVKQLVEFGKLSPDTNLRLITLLQELQDAFGKATVGILEDVVQAVESGDMASLHNKLMARDIPLSTSSSLLSLAQELDAVSREKLDKLVRQAKRGAISLGKIVISRAIAALV